MTNAHLHCHGVRAVLEQVLMWKQSEEDVIIELAFRSDVLGLAVSKERYVGYCQLCICSSYSLRFYIAFLHCPFVDFAFKDHLRSI